MKLPNWLKPALWGGVAGAALVAIAGFGFGGWTTAGSAQEMADLQSRNTVSEALAPYCVDRAMSDPNTVALMAEFEAAGRSARSTLIQDAGWATLMGSDEPNPFVARECLKLLAENL